MNLCRSIELELFVRRSWRKHLERLNEERFRLSPDELSQLSGGLRAAGVLPDGAVVQSMNLNIYRRERDVVSFVVEFNNCTFIFDAEQFPGLAEHSLDDLYATFNYSIKRYVGEYKNEPFDDVYAAGGISVVANAT